MTRLGGFAAFESPDGQYLYYAKGRSSGGLWRKRLPDGAEEVFIPELKAGFWGYWALAPKGHLLPGLARPRQAGRHLVAAVHAERARRSGRSRVRPPSPIRASHLSPDGRYLLYSQVDQSGSDILILEHYRE